MAQAKDGDAVQIHYTGSLDDGTEFDSSIGGPPLAFTVGSGQVIKGFDDAVRGMTVDEQKTFRIPPEEAYGEIREDLVLQVPRTQLPPELEPEVGTQLQLTTDAGQQIPVVIIAVEDEAITIDANHILAGQALTFDITLVSIGE